jgi:type II secretion system protein H
MNRKGTKARRHEATKGIQAPRPPLRAFPEAFTLIELLMVMAIIAIVAGLLAPRLVGFTLGRSASNTARMIVSLTNYARSQSISEGRTYRLNFDSAAKQFFLTAQDGAQYDAPTSDFGQKLTLPDGITAAVQFPQEQDGVYVQFQPTGRTEQAQIRLTDQLSRITEIDCGSPTELFRILPASEVQK